MGLQNLSASWFVLTHICWKVHNWLHANSALNHKTIAGFNAYAMLKLNEPWYSMRTHEPRYSMRTQSKTEEESKRKQCTHCIQYVLQEIIIYEFVHCVIYGLHLSLIGLIWEKKICDPHCGILVCHPKEMWSAHQDRIMNIYIFWNPIEFWISTNYHLRPYLLETDFPGNDYMWTYWYLTFCWVQ